MSKSKITSITSKSIKKYLPNELNITLETEKGFTHDIETNYTRPDDRDQALFEAMKLERCSNWVENQKKYINCYEEIGDDSEVILQNNTIIVQSIKRVGKRKISDEDSDDVDNDLQSDIPSKTKTPRPKYGTGTKHLTLECEWKCCKFKSEDYQTFLSHVKSHMHQLPIKSTIENGELYSCAWDICDFETNDDKTIIRHVNFHGYHTKLKSVGMNIRNRYELPRCVQDSSNRNTIPEYAEAFTCNWEDCDDIFQSAQEFYDHIRCHVVSKKPSKIDKVTSFQCGWKGCMLIQRFYHYLVSHARTHSGERQLACPHCGNMFATQAKYIDHCRRQIPVELQNFKCVECNKTFASQRLLKDHMRVHVNSYKCSLCDMSCVFPSSIALHMRYRHLNDKTFQCHLCDHTSTRKNDMDMHISSHDIENKYECNEEDCEFACRALTTLTRHVAIVHGDGIPLRYCCHNCDTKFTTGHELTKHLMSTHGFRWPSGHSKFKYKEDDDGFYRLQTTRYESLEVSQQIINTSINQELASSLNKSYKIAQMDPVKGGTASFVIYGADETPTLNNFVKSNPIPALNKKSLLRESAEEKPLVLSLKQQKSIKDEILKKCDISTLNIIKDESSQTDSNLGSIDDFSVMKRYIKKTKNVVITIDDVDENGKVVKSQILNSNEIMCETNITKVKSEPL